MMNVAEHRSAPSWTGWKVGFHFPSVLQFTSMSFMQKRLLMLLFVFLVEKEQTPLQEALNQLIRQLQRCGIGHLLE